MNENNLSHNNNENPTNKLYDHFKTLHSAPDPNTLSAFQIHMLNDKKRLEDSNHLQSELDNPISIEEIDKATEKLKNKKAAGLDGIRNEMIKTSSRFLKCNGQVVVESEVKKKKKEETTSRDCLVLFVLYSSKTPSLFSWSYMHVLSIF